MPVSAARLDIYGELCTLRDSPGHFYRANFHLSSSAVLRKPETCQLSWRKMSLLGIIYSTRKNVSHVAERCFFADTFYITRAVDKKLARNDNLPKVLEKFRNLKIAKAVKGERTVPKYLRRSCFSYALSCFLSSIGYRLLWRSMHSLWELFLLWMFLPMLRVFWVQRSFD